MRTLYQKKNKTIGGTAQTPLVGQKKAGFLVCWEGQQKYVHKKKTRFDKNTIEGEGEGNTFSPGVEKKAGETKSAMNTKSTTYKKSTTKDKRALDGTRAKEVGRGGRIIGKGKRTFNY